MKTILAAALLAAAVFPASAGADGPAKHKNLPLTPVGMQIYQSQSDLRSRIGNNMQPLASYTAALIQQLYKLWPKTSPTSAKGLLIAVGVKPGRRSRFWVDAVEGSLPSEIIIRLQAGLERVKPLAVHNGPIAFALSFEISGQKVAHFPKIPAAWAAASEHLHKNYKFPDDLFNLIWKN